RRHPHQTRHPQNDPQHCQQRSKLVRPNLLKPNKNGIEQIHYSYLNAWIGCNRDALNAGINPATIPINTLAPNANNIAVAVITGVLSVGESVASPCTRINEVANPAMPPRIANTTLSIKI